MAEPNPDDGLVPEISELYKRNPAEWQREAKKRTQLDATMQKLEEVEASLDNGESSGKSTNNDNEDATKMGDTNANNTTEHSDAKESRTSEQAENVENVREAKRSKLSSRK